MHKEPVQSTCQRAGSTRYMHVIERSHWNLPWNHTPSSTMDYDWLGMRSEQQRLTAELIETRLTKDILLGGTGGRDESSPIQRLWK